jgi:hypothetical protein
VAAFIVGEVGSERSGERLATFWIAWRLAVKIGVGATLIVVGAVGSDGWAAAVPVAFGVWLILSGLVIARLHWLEMRETAAGGDG